jgi:CubicO group peptidase (beta-lactamase class C family)
MIRKSTGPSPRRCAARRAALLLLPLLICCDSLTGPGDGLRRPRQTSDGWVTASVEAVGMDPAPLQALLDLISTTDNHLIHSILIVKDGKLVFEEYWPGTDLTPYSLAPVGRDFDRHTLHYVASVSKSITSALMGIASDQSLVGSIQEPVFSFFPEYEDLRGDENSQITLQHLLSFSSGYDWNEFVYGFDDPRDSHNQMFAAPDPMAFLLGRPVLTPPGSVFHYNSGDTNILGEIVRRASSSETLVAFADRYLFQPLGIVDFDWMRFPLAQEVTFASGGASLRPRDMAKLGALYLNEGIWDGTRILSSAWVEASTRMSTPLEGSHRALYGYGYNWWLGRSQFRDRKVDYFRASGWGGQEVYVFQELDMVVVFTRGAYYETSPLDVNDIIEHYIFPAVSG